MATCRYCGAKIRYVHPAGGWLHVAPLAELRVSHVEADNIKHDPPRPGWQNRRPTHLHPAQPT